jgi:hypothetical protein
MTTVVSRTLRSSPHRSASDTWKAIVELLTQGRTGDARNELSAVSGIASSIIADRVAKDTAIIATCDGPRTRIYCSYDEDALDGADANEDSLGFDPLKGDWQVSLPCEPDDLAWVQGALKKHSTRITARDTTAAVSVKKAELDVEVHPLTLDPKKFLEP